MKSMTCCGTARLDASFFAVSSSYSVLLVQPDFVVVHSPVIEPVVADVWPVKAVVAHVGLIRNHWFNDGGCRPVPMWIAAYDLDEDRPGRMPATRIWVAGIHLLDAMLISTL